MEKYLLKVFKLYRYLHIYCAIVPAQKGYQYVAAIAKLLTCTHRSAARLESRVVEQVQAMATGVTGDQELSL